MEQQQYVTKQNPTLNRSGSLFFFFFSSGYCQKSTPQEQFNGKCWLYNCLEKFSCSLKNLILILENRIWFKIWEVNDRASYQFGDNRFVLSRNFICLFFSSFKVFFSFFPIQLSRECRAEVQRILHQRALDVKLDPALQDKCLIDLGKWCSEKTETGQVGDGASICFL